MSTLPTGTVTFLFTDIASSTELMERYPDAYPLVLDRHHALLHHAIETHGGAVFNVVGDAVCAAFADARGALTAALEAQRAIQTMDGGQQTADAAVNGQPSAVRIRVRVGLHTGEAEARGSDYASSLSLVRVQRCMSAAHGGQTLLSTTTADCVRAHLPHDISLRDLGEHRLRGLARPERIFQLLAPDLPSEFPPLRVSKYDDAESARDAKLDQLVSGQLVGRTREVEQLRQHWANARQGHAHFVVLSGEPGVGKTRLAQTVALLAAQSGGTILRGGCYEYEATTPYLPFVEALRDWVHAQAADELRAFESLAPELVKLAPEIETKLGALTRNPTLTPNDERLRLFDHVARFLQTLASQNGLLLLLDDLHWADQGTLTLLSYLLRHLRPERVLVLAAYRDVELDRAHPLAAALVDWHRERLSTRIHLGRLSL
ncbi:MAG: AAA family ATPase, partial [Chloroflexi bacterium]|nr:AAA family ATPase [Chloroflexota bacterium]